jgi:hypothetical protein
MRRLAPLHWWARAENARLTTFLLWQLQNDAAAKAVATECGYYGTPSIALFEAFLREAAVSLELVIKAAIAWKLKEARADPAKVGIPATHDLPALWKQAGLPGLPREDEYRLLRFKSILMWSGRYATPRTAEAWEKENEVFRALEGPSERKGRLVIRQTIRCGWEDFDQLYQMAAAVAPR